MKKKASVLLMVMFFSIFGKVAMADEGMWILMLLNKNIDEMQKKGLKLTAEDIYSINHSSLKDAIIQFAGGCTGEIVSPEGLILTNHHCGFGSIQSHSTVEHDYLTNGFWAMNRSEELPCPGINARFFVRMEDVTTKSLNGITSSMSEKERDDKIQENIKAIKKEAQTDPDYEIVVKPFYNGNAYYMFVNLVYTDVRLVGAPPSSIGKFGADTDNWMWPRHTADFSMFRVYSSKDGKPAKFNKDNVAFKPRHHLPVSIKGVKENDFVMIMGYPGTTDRYLTSYGINNALKYKNNTIVTIRDKKLETMREFMFADPAIRIQYASKYASTANYWKYYIGQTKQLVNNKVAEKKKELEDEFTTWVNQNQGRKAKYGTVLQNINDAFAKLGTYEVWRNYFTEGVARGPEIFSMAWRFNGLADMLKTQKDSTAKINSMTARLSSSLDAFFKDYNKNLDKKMVAEVLSLYSKNVTDSLQPKYFKKLVMKNKGNFEKIATTIFEQTIFTDKSKIELLLKNPDAKIIENDLAFQIAAAFYNQYFDKIDQIAKYNDQLAAGNRLFVAGLLEMNPTKQYAANANSTIRLTYGQVLPYSPIDAVTYKYYTTLDGVMQKEDPNNWEYVVPAKLKTLWQNKDFGEYAENGVLKTCFLSNTDITGGNSGSPVINGEGQLVGIAFDGNWEAMSGDIAFEPKLQRTISVDIRYVLFIIDKYAGAKHLINEMTVIR
ncbi:MAG: S46 family peptidase [Bacteroidota bacterium]